MQQADETSAAETVQGTGQSTALIIMPSSIVSPVCADPQNQAIQAVPLVAEEDRRTPDEKLIALWLHGRSLHTQRAYRADVLRFVRHVRKPLVQVTLGDVQAFADFLNSAEQDLRLASQSRILSSIKSLLAFGHRLGILIVDVGAPLKLPSLRNRLAERILPEPDLQRLLARETNKRNAVLLRLLYAAGLRVSELCGLKWRDVVERGEAGQVSVYGKGGKTRAILLSASTWQALQSLRNENSTADSPVFPSRKKKGHLDPSQVLRIVRAAAKRADIGLNVSPHWLRHAHASHALDRGAPIHLVQQTLGHESVATTGRYLHARPSDSSARYLGV